MSPEQLALLKEIQAVEFTCVDLNLYLDTHPCDERALADYNANVQQLACLKNEYTQRYGPLMHFGQEPVCGQWSWICEPWPWEIKY
ncbi:MAG: spore coat protein CotJB [Bacteroidota bacterium]